MFSLTCASLLNSLEKIVIYRNFRYFDLNKYDKKAIFMFFKRIY